MKTLIAVGVGLLVLLITIATPLHQLFITPTSERMICEVAHEQPFTGRSPERWGWRCHPVGAR